MVIAREEGAGVGRELEALPIRGAFSLGGAFGPVGIDCDDAEQSILRV